MQRRELLALLGGAAVFPLAARAQGLREGPRRLGVLSISAAGEPVVEARPAALSEALAALGWEEGGNLRTEWRNGGSDTALIARFADELVALAPDVLLAIGTPCVAELKQRTTTIPIVFTVVTDPVGQGLVRGLSRPGGNVTGFTDYDGPMAGKWLGMLTQVTPPASRVTAIYNPATAPFADLMLRALEAAAASLAVALRQAPVADGPAIAATVASLAMERNAALLVLPDFFTFSNRASILAAAAKAGVPAVYWSRAFVDDGGLMSYGTDSNDLLRRAAGYIDRILKGAKAGELPVQNPTKFELAINLKTARALGVTIGPSLLATADEVIE